MGDAVVGDRVAESGVRSVTSPGTNATFATSVFGQDEPQPAGVFLQVVDPDLVAAGEQVADDPRPDEPVPAGDQHAHRHAPNDSARSQARRHGCDGGCSRFARLVLVISATGSSRIADVLAGDLRDRDDLVALVQVHHPHALGVAADDADVVHLLRVTMPLR